MSCEIRDLRHETQRQLILDRTSKQSYSASVDLAPRIRPFHSEITRTVPELWDYKQVSPFTSCSQRQMGQEGILDAWR